MRDGVHAVAGAGYLSCTPSFLGFYPKPLVEVDINEDLNQWLYGSTPDTISYLQEIFESQKKVEIIEQVCTGCSSMIEFIIKDIDDHAVQTNWLVVECVTCSELNLIPTGKNIRLQN
ncbi:hypothetical protein GOQ04_00460 [Emticicia sp. ODNR4P]|nr:hypothetical protein [Emticicia sp. ODNR4P]